MLASRDCELLAGLSNLGADGSEASREWWREWWREWLREWWAACESPSGDREWSSTSDEWWASCNLADDSFVSAPGHPTRTRAAALPIAALPIAALPIVALPIVALPIAALPVTRVTEEGACFDGWTKTTIGVWRGGGVRRAEGDGDEEVGEVEAPPSMKLDEGARAGDSSALRPIPLRLLESVLAGALLLPARERGVLTRGGAREGHVAVSRVGWMNPFAHSHAGVHPLPPECSQWSPK